MKKERGILKPVSKGHGGVKAPHYKNTEKLSAVRFDPEKVTISMQQNIGAPCTPTVKVGDEVKIGQIIGDSDQFMSVPVHASVSGKVTGIKEIKNATGRVSTAVEITSDKKNELDESIKPPVISNKEDFLKAVRDSGLVGLGGAGFPTHVKLNVPKDKNVDTLIINGAECEPFITVDYREIMDNSWDIISGVFLVKEMLDIHNVVICSEDNKPESFKILKSIADNSEDNFDEIKIMKLPAKYPQGAEKILIQSATGRRVPPGKLPADVGCIVMNVASIATLARYVKTGVPLVSRSLTVDGSAITNPKNVEVPIGTSIKDIVDFCGGYNGSPAKIIAGGPMMGFAIEDDTVPVCKNNNAVLAFDEKFLKLHDNSACIRCGRCVGACPMSLMPTNIERLTKLNSADELIKAGAMNCMECGSCAFVCPAHRPLVQSMRYAKDIIRKESKKK